MWRERGIFEQRERERNVKRRDWSQLNDGEMRRNVRIARERVKERDQVFDGEA
jgi:hypothetical protein